MENSNLQLSNASKGGGVVEKLGNCGNNLKDICESVEETDTQLNMRVAYTTQQKVSNKKLMALLILKV